MLLYKYSSQHFIETLFILQNYFMLCLANGAISNKNYSSIQRLDDKITCWRVLEIIRNYKNNGWVISKVNCWICSAKFPDYVILRIVTFQFYLITIITICETETAITDFINYSVLSISFVKLVFLIQSDLPKFTWCLRILLKYLLFDWTKY